MTESKWESFKLGIRSNKKELSKICLLVFSLISIIVVVLVIVFHRTHKTSEINTLGSNTFNGPADINGDPVSSSTTFGSPQMINNTTGAQAFASQLAAHEAGYIAASINNTYSDPQTGASIVIYKTNLQGAISFPQTLALPAKPSSDKLFIADMVFAPILNTVGEFYYLFVSIGQVISNGYVATIPKNVIVYSLDTSAIPTASWVLSNFVAVGVDKNLLTQVIGTSTNSLKLPSSWSSLEAGSHQIWDGAFGLKLKVVVDSTGPAQKHGLFIAGSAHPNNRNGGSIYWYVIENNSANPIVFKRKNIKDTKLTLLADAYGTTNSPVKVSPAVPIDPTAPVTIDQALNGFGSDFHVSLSSITNAFLIVGNPSGDDWGTLTAPNPTDPTHGTPVQQSGSPNGYVQIFTFNSATRDFEMTTGDDPQVFQNRILGNNLKYNGKLVNGFGNSVWGNINRVMVGTFDTSGFWLYNTIDADKPNILSSNILQTKLAFTELTHKHSKRTSNFISLQNINNDMVINSFNLIPNGQAISVVKPGSVSDKDTGITYPEATFDSIQGIGDIFNVNQFTGLEQFDIMTNVGFAQKIGSWVSRTRATTFLVFNDPFYIVKTSPQVLGRFIVLHRFA